jgi:hypothetical protein
VEKEVEMVVAVEVVMEEVELQMWSQCFHAIYISITGYTFSSASCLRSAESGKAASIYHAAAGQQLFS